MSSTTRKPRLAEVAKLAGVSPGLVSRILNGDPTVRARPETRAAVLSAIEMLNYTPHPSARALRNARTGLLGFALHHVNDPIYAEMVDRAQSAAARHNFSIILLNTAELAERGEAFRNIVLGRRLDGLLIQSGFGAGEDVLHEIARTVPSVVFSANPTADMRTMRLDDARAAAVATQHLIDTGHTSIAYVGAPGVSSERRFEGYRTTLVAAGLPWLPAVNGGWTADDGHDSTVRFLGSGARVTAIVAVTATTALGVHSGIVASGRRIPDDVSLVSVHDTWYARHLNPPLTAVTLPLGELGALAVAELIDQIDTPREGETIVADPQPRLVVRGSTKAIQA
ncbi:LacI family DNA-binding transcriptional regulator [Dactylosporangium sp. AC04546]|uniref:LacI family DNA-binding transcriptional regulator n=1 Tax=Dactylosporangium sp. AC04546 TaxID=2862460 RepID=UPI001EDF1CCD|nr:LacI family DNA-binding transcriptional regulator [Dactylosporangium sp. AC04546]WVK79802.1 LacI family DNA-binding transcriptional regulator [Dactylosporangium sp. AC04546]